MSMAIFRSLLLSAALLLTCCTRTSTADYWCLKLQESLADRLTSRGCDPPWTDSRTQCVGWQNAIKQFLSSLGCPYVAQCDVEGGDRCLPLTYTCSISGSGQCQSGQQCCKPPSSSCDCRQLQECMMPDKCLAIPGAQVMADKSCYAAPSKKYVCCQTEPVCKLGAGDRCLPSLYNCSVSTSGACPAGGTQCCGPPNGPCDVSSPSSGQLCLKEKECRSVTGSVIEGDKTCDPAGLQVCCQKTLCDIRNGDRCLPSSYNCTLAAFSGQCSPAGQQCCGPPLGQCDHTNVTSGQMCVTEAACAAMSGSSVLADLTCDSPGTICCQKQERACEQESGDETVCRSTSIPCNKAYGTCESDNDHCCVSECNTLAGKTCLPKNYTCATSNSGPCEDPDTQCCSPPTGLCGHTVPSTGHVCKPPEECLSIPSAVVLANLDGCNEGSDLCCNLLPVDDCAANPCLNGGTCTDGINTFTCKCPVGFTGSTCETNINDCATNPCLNRGTCTDGINTFTCRCPPGFTGSKCETNIDDCAPNPCLNQGTCTDEINTFTCRCPAGFTGSKCETSM